MARFEDQNYTLVFFWLLLSLKWYRKGWGCHAFWASWQPCSQLRFEPFPEQKATIRPHRSTQFPTTVRLPLRYLLLVEPNSLLSGYRSDQNAVYLSARISPAPLSWNPIVPASTYSVTYCQVLCQTLYRTGIPVPYNSVKYTLLCHLAGGTWGLGSLGNWLKLAGGKSDPWLCYRHSHAQDGVSAKQWLKRKMKFLKSL